MKKESNVITLIGFQGSGKTLLGTQLGEHLDFPFMDTDRLIEKKFPEWTCREIFIHLGEENFRELEFQVIESLKFDFPFILASGGGTLTHSKSQKILKDKTHLIYLQTHPSILKERLSKRERPPAYLKDKNFEALYEERSKIYEICADHKIEMDHLNSDDAMKEIFNYLKRTNYGI